MEELREVENVIHKTTGLLNFLGGSFTIEDLHKDSFAKIVDSLIRNGGTIVIDKALTVFECKDCGAIFDNDIFGSTGICLRCNSSKIIKRRR